MFFGTVYGKENTQVLELIKNSNKTLIAGIIDARNIYISNIEQKVEFKYLIEKDDVIFVDIFKNRVISVKHELSGVQRETSFDLMGGDDSMKDDDDFMKDDDDFMKDDD